MEKTITVSETEFEALQKALRDQWHGIPVAAIADQYRRLLDKIEMQAGVNRSGLASLPN